MKKKVMARLCTKIVAETKKIEPDCREGVRVQLERMKELCKERDSLYDFAGTVRRLEINILVLMVAR